MTLLIPAFVFMAFAHSAIMMYIGLTLFAFGKWNPSLLLVFKSQNMQHLFVESVLHPFILYLKKNALSVFVVYCHELSGMVSIPLRLWEQSGPKSLACKDSIILTFSEV